MSSTKPSRAKEKTTFYCTECGNHSLRWQGQCGECGAWNTLKEEPVGPKRGKGAGAAARSRNWAGGQAEGTHDLGLVEAGEQAPRVMTGVGELDRVLGGGVVEGSVVLLGGDPGIGKSTLLLQALASMASAGKKVMYVTGEESLAQVADRGGRLGLRLAGCMALAETETDSIVEQAGRDRPAVLVVDSIQTLHVSHVESAPGTVSQVRESAALLTRFAKQTGTAVFLVGHVTKEGNIAGPRVLEHMVDTVLYFEGDPQSPYRLVRALKNRFGSVHEIGAFEMGEQGLISVDNPSAMFLSADRQRHPGSCVFVLQEGPRALLLDIQALADDMAGTHPKRVAVGLDGNRLSMLMAVLHKHGGLDLGDRDVFVNAVGGVKVSETAVDLPLLMALISSLTGRSLPTDLACFGEIGLTGEVRPVQRAEMRLREAAMQGFTQAVIPTRCMPPKPIPGIKVVGVRTVAEAVQALSDLD